ncbi:NAD(P)/FAD-dependent oxidoreductase [Ilumatobacter sp.]|uniref:NAD(P)/FAD-dependent oxidoreductase n=1 Tax=Ilumatobacter sp. TaxID=1967498 RepID=UPI003B517B86
MASIVIIGGGFAGVWAAASAARLRRGTKGADYDITLVSMTDDMVIRPRLYEAKPHEMKVALADVLDPIDVRRVRAKVNDIDTSGRTITATDEHGHTVELDYDRLVVASGSQVVKPTLDGAEHLFDIDTIEAATQLDEHLAGLAQRDDDGGRHTIVVVGAGFTGLEIATEIGARVSDIAPDAPVRVVLVERESDIGPELGPGPRPVIAESLASLDIEVLTGVSLEALTASSARLSDGTEIDTHTVIWTAGMLASPLTELIGADRDELGRLSVDEFLRVNGVDGVFAGGDTAAAPVEDGHTVMQSCQHAVPAGKFVGHNVAADLLGEPLVAFAPTPYVTCLDLGPTGAVATSGFDREVTMTGSLCKDLKQTINAKWIYPPTGDADALLELAGPRADWPEWTPPEEGAVEFATS